MCIRDSMKTDECDFPTVRDGLRGMELIAKAVESADAGSKWVSVP